MAVITLNTVNIPFWRFGGTTAKLRIYANQTFDASDNTPIMQGSPSRGTWYKEVTCTIDGTTLTVPQTTIYSTTDSSVPTATYQCVFFDNNGTRKLQVWTANLRVRHQTTPTTWHDLIEYSKARQIRLPDTYYTADQINQNFYTKAEFDAIFLPYLPDISAPTIPQNFSLTNQGGGTILADWDASTDTQTGVQEYELEITIA